MLHIAQIIIESFHIFLNYTLKFHFFPTDNSRSWNQKNGGGKFSYSSTMGGVGGGGVLGGGGAGGGVGGGGAGDSLNQMGGGGGEGVGGGDILRFTDNDISKGNNSPFQF